MRFGHAWDRWRGRDGSSGKSRADERPGAVSEATQRGAATPDARTKTFEVACCNMAGCSFFESFFLSGGIVSRRCYAWTGLAGFSAVGLFGLGFTARFFTRVKQLNKVSSRTSGRTEAHRVDFSAELCQVRLKSHSPNCDLIVQGQVVEKDEDSEETPFIRISV